MVFSSLIFLFMFLPLVLLGYFGLLRKCSLKVKNRFLLLASLFFYGWGEPVYVFLMIGCIFYNYLFGRWADLARRSSNRKSGHIAIVLMLICNLSILGVFKYTDFVLSNLNTIFGLSLPLPEIVLPIGISFFIFQGISYVIDVYRGNGQAQKNPLDVGLYIAFFPQLIAGPIVRYNTIAKEIKNRRENADDFADGISIFVIGLAKKAIIANNIAIVADKAFALSPTSELSVAMAWLGAIAYTLQIYFDFGGYSDMAIGLGRMFGFHFLANFNFPYISRSVSEFWRRWHISLGSWFRDYVYFPLGGSRVGKLRLVFNLLVVWFLTGLWHGANWTFICWGLFYFFWIALEKITGLGKKMERTPVVSTVFVMFLVVLGWVMFRAETMTQALQYMAAMFNGYGTGLWDANAQMYLHDYKWFFIFGIICALPVKNWCLQAFKRNKALTDGQYAKILQIIGIICLAVLLVVATAFLAKGSYNPFIYFNF
ncbi:MAG: MBOAT family O-acyltransferase [Bacillota bacterium]|jgi:alginate O-acetyltransferase complex protein AlgI